MFEQNRKIQKDAFTLMELLVVISIIALLMSILMPSLQNAKEQARRVVCASQFKQFGLAAMGYAYNNNDWLPAGHWGENTSIYNWQAFKFDWNISHKIPKCPSSGRNLWPMFNWENAEWPFVGPQENCTGYTSPVYSYYSYWGGFGGLSPDCGWTTGVWKGWLTNKFVREYLGGGQYSKPVFKPVPQLSDARQPSSQPLAQDYSLRYEFVMNSTGWQHISRPPRSNHSKSGAPWAAGANMLYVDGHVEWDSFTRNNTAVFMNDYWGESGIWKK